MPSEREPLLSRANNLLASHDTPTASEDSLWVTARGHVVAASGELLGTTLFLFYAFATHLMAVTQAHEKKHSNHDGLASQTIVFISLGYGFSLLVNAWIFYRVCGGLFNPAVSQS